MGLFAIEHADLVAELADDQDMSVLDKLTSGSGKMLRWVCDQHGVYERPVRHRVYGRKCPVCVGSIPEPGVGDLLTVHPHLREFWDYDANTADPATIFPTTVKAYWWKCPDGHAWEENARNVAERESTCPPCTVGEDEVSRGVPVREKVFTPLDPTVAATFHPDKNPGVEVSSISKSSREKFWWLCDHGHEWESTTHNRSIGRNCPTCSSHLATVGVNDFATQFPILSSLWSPDNDRSASAVVPGSEYVAQWVCKLGHKWSSKVSDLTRKGDRDDFACPVCNSRTIVPGFNDVATTHPHLLVEWSNQNSISLREVSAGSKTVLTWECSQGHEWQARVSDRCRLRKDGCRRCSSSQGEKDLRAWMESLGVEIVAQSRGVVPPHELDIYLPELNMAVEFNGLYWHSESFKDKKYHLNKSAACAAVGIRLFHIWEDDWMLRQDVVKSMLLAKMGLSKDRKIPGRKCSVATISADASAAFLDAHHIQGSSAATHYLGLFHEGELVAVTNLTATSGDLVLDRYATSVIVQGGFGKMLSYVEKNLSYKKIITYADLTVSDGKLYDDSGFSLIRTTSPDYHYLYRGRRVHKFNFRKSKFKSNPDLAYEDGMTERQLAALNKLYRVYDCGKKVYVKEHPSIAA